jgi:hypothetical protein
MVLFTFTKGKANHTCPVDDKQLVPFTKEEEALIGGVLLEYPDFSEAWTKVFAPLVKDVAYRGNGVFSKIHTMTEAKLRAFAKDRNIKDGDATGAADFLAAQQFATELKDTQGYPVSVFTLPGHDYVPSDEVLLVRPDAGQIINKADMLLLIGSPIGVALVAECGTMLGSDASFKTLVYGKVKIIVVSVTSHDENMTAADHGRKVKERGHACFMALVTSERAEVQEVIALEIQAGVNKFLAEKHHRLGRSGPPPVMDVKIFMSGEWSR